MSLADNIRLHRQARDWTQQRLADELNVSVQTVYSWETGAVLPRLVMLEAMCIAFKTNPNVLLGWRNA